MLLQMLNRSFVLQLKTNSILPPTPVILNLLFCSQQLGLEDIKLRLFVTHVSNLEDFPIPTGERIGFMPPWTDLPLLGNTKDNTLTSDDEH